MGWSLVTTSAPAAEPVSLALAKEQCRETLAGLQDDLITAWIQAAREYAEEFTCRRFVTQTVRLTLDWFPPDWGTGYDVCDRAIELPGGVVSSVTSVKYIDTDGDQQTLVANTDYRTHLDHLPPLVYPAPDTYWPETQTGRLGTVEVIYVAGYGAATAVPKPIVQAILLTVGHWYGRRGDAREPADEGLPPGALRLLNTYAVRVYS